MVQPNENSGPFRDGDSRGKSASDIARSLPFSDEAERGVLSCMLQRPEEGVAEAMELLTPDDFYSPSNRLIYALLLEMHDQHMPIEPNAILQLLGDRNQLDAVGGATAILDVYACAGSPTYLSYYGKIVQNKSLLRTMIQACGEGIEKAYTEGDRVDELLDEVETSILAVRDSRDQGGPRPISDLIGEVVEEFDRMVTNPGSMRGTPTGFPVLDSMTNGLHSGDMFVIAARPSMGKTSLVMNMVEHVSVDHGKPSLVFSLEMSQKILVQRMVVSRAQLSMSKLRNGLLTRDEKIRLMRAVSDFQNSTIIIDETAGISILELRRKARRIKKVHKELGMIAIDYLQLMRSTSRRAQDNRQIEIAEISAGIKALAKELEVPIVVLAQLNRQVEQRKGGRPMLSDLRESGSIEQDADLVGLLTRSDYAGSKGQDEDDKKEDKDSNQPGRSLLIIAKHRNGPTGDVGLTFLNESMRFVPREMSEGEGE